jgi:leader peptidase (prepilin peptidase)/N-methyltransferase
MRLDELLRLHPDSWGLVPMWLARTFVFAFGLLWGSFLNVVIYRVPRDMSVVHPGSHCPGCGKPIAGYDNIPLFTWLILRGKSRCCGTRISPRYPAVELLGGVLSLAVFEVAIMSLPGGTPAHRALAIYGADFTLCLGLVAAAFIDAEHMFLPDSITIGGTILGIATASFRDLPFTQSLIGAGVGFVGVWLPFIFLYKGVLGRTGMGMGDAKLLALAGAWFGWPGAVITLLAGAVQGTVFTGLTWALGIKAKLPDAVLADIKELEELAAAGDEEAKKALEEDPLTEDPNDAFIVRFFRRLFKIADPDPAPELEGPPTEEEWRIELEQATRARLPFGPFLILAILELLFAGDWLKAHLLPFFWPLTLD